MLSLIDSRKMYDQLRKDLAMSSFPRFLLVGCFLALCFNLAPTDILAGDIVRIPLDLSDDLVYLSGSHVEVMPFASGQDWPEILDVRLHLTGSYCCFEVIYTDCFGPPGGVGCFDPGLVCGFMVEDEEMYTTEHLLPGIWDDSTNFATCEDQDYDQEFTFDTGSDTTDWSFLAQGTGTVFLTGLPKPIFCAYPVCCSFGSSAETTSAELIVELATVTPTEQHSWGTIKAIYR